MITLPLIIPFLIWGAVALVGAAGAAYAISNFKKGETLGILGMKVSGKTLFLSHLRKTEFLNKESGRDQYEKFKYKLKNGDIIKIKAGFDLGGNFRADYDKVIKESDHLFYFFDINSYLKNEIIPGTSLQYQRECNSRFEHIHSLLNNKRIYIIASHSDKLQISNTQALKEFEKIIEGKSYHNMLRNIYMVNLTSKEERNKLIDKIFNTKS